MIMVLHRSQKMHALYTLLYITVSDTLEINVKIGQTYTQVILI